MYLFKQNEKWNEYVGLWSVWWLNSGEVAGAKIVFATLSRRDFQEEKSPLDKVPWLVLQLQTMTSEDNIWPDIYKTLKDDIESKSGETPPSQRCAGNITYDSMQRDMARRDWADPQLLQEYTITRIDDENTVSSRPSNVLNRKRIPYSVHRGRADDLHVQPIHVFIERMVSKKASLGQRLHSETGLSKVTTLLSAVNEWRTWIVLAPSG